MSPLLSVAAGNSVFDACSPRRQPLRGRSSLHGKRFKIMKVRMDRPLHTHTHKNRLGCDEAPICVTEGGKAAAGLAQAKHSEGGGHRFSGQALLKPESLTKVGGSGRAGGSGRLHLKKKRKRKKTKPARSSGDWCPGGQVLLPSCPARLPGQRRWQSTE